MHHPIERCSCGTVVLGPGGLCERCVRSRALVSKHVDDITGKRAALLDGLAKAYLEATGLRPDQCELVEDRSDMARVTWYFRQREAMHQADGAHHPGCPAAMPPATDGWGDLTPPQDIKAAILAAKEAMLRNAGYEVKHVICGKNVVLPDDADEPIIVERTTQ